MSDSFNSFLLDPDFNWVKIQKSSIHSLGLFSNRIIHCDQCLGIAMIKEEMASPLYIKHLIKVSYGGRGSDGWLRTIGARFLNHSANGNIRMEYHNDNQVVVAYADREINKGEELTANYVPTYQKLGLIIPEFCKTK